MSILSNKDYAYLEAMLSKFEEVTIERRLVNGVVEVTTSTVSYPWDVPMVASLKITLLGRDKPSFIKHCKTTREVAEELTFASKVLHLKERS